MTPYLSDPDALYGRIAHSASRLWYWPGADREDVEQEAWLALVQTRPQAPALVQRHLKDCVKSARRLKRPVFTELHDVHPGPDLMDRLEARERLRGIFAADLSECERQALGRIIAGDPLASKRDDNARQRVRRKLAVSLFATEGAAS